MINEDKKRLSANPQTRRNTIPKKSRGTAAFPRSTISGEIPPEVSYEQRSSDHQQIHSPDEEQSPYFKLCSRCQTEPTAQPLHWMEFEVNDEQRKSACQHTHRPIEIQSRRSSEAQLHSSDRRSVEKPHLNGEQRGHCQHLRRPD